MSRFVTEIEHQAKKHAEQIVINEDMREGFKRGARWAVEKLDRLVSVSSMEDLASKSTKKFMNKLRLEEVNEFVSEMLRYRDEDTEPADGKGGEG